MMTRHPYPAQGHDHTLMVAPADWVLAPELHSLSLDGPGLVEESGYYTKQRFKVRFARSMGGRESTGLLVKKMYGQKGYDLADALPTSLERITIAADFQQHVIGTLSIGLGDSGKLFAEHLYPGEVGALRRQGRRVCEYTRLAIDSDVRSRRVIAALFHIAYLYPAKLLGYSDAVIEVNPRHAAFYKRMLGFEQLGEERLCSRVNAPAILLRVDFDYVAQQVRRIGGRCEPGGDARSLYPYFFSPDDETGIVARLRKDS